MSESYVMSLIAGAGAGIAVDTTLFPLDTLKTRLQSPSGFSKAGGFQGLYKGIGPAFLGSAPTAALFFCSYDFIKRELTLKVNHQHQPLVHMAAAASAEVVSCLVKVPTEVLKQRQQVGQYSSNILEACTTIYHTEGVHGFYRGLSSTVFREIPFAIIQFPLWEALKMNGERWKGKALDVQDKALCGAIAGGVAAGLTTPVDVIKTQVILSQRMSDGTPTFCETLKNIYSKKGLNGLFAGFVPRVLWITLGGAIFFGSYEFCIDTCKWFHSKL